MHQQKKHINKNLLNAAEANGDMAVKIFPRELIGKEIIIVRAANPQLVGWQGRIIDETRNSLKVISNQGEAKMLLKNSLAFKIKGTEIIISGNQIFKRPEERLKG